MSAVLVVGSMLVLVAWALASRKDRRVSYAVRGALNGLVLDVGDADVQVVGGGRARAAELLRTDRYAFGHGVRTRRSVAGGEFRLRSRCPSEAIARSCSAAYRVLVPDNVPVTIRTDAGDVGFRDYTGSARVTTDEGDVDVESYCGFSLRVRTERGDVLADASCAPQRLSLRSTSGDVRAVVPSARYRLEADSSSGAAVVRGVTQAPDALFELQAISTSGDVLVETRR
ncbi:MAG TPA: DUF4097 family beta strand repeat-containing protein [Solirubrobacteraceae bacterium]|nr:DUF4097 family beta strand repeat-containing protein [Solirubrobacteraceae bacterium]